MILSQHISMFCILPIRTFKSLGIGKSVPFMKCSTEWVSEDNKNKLGLLKVLLILLYVLLYSFFFVLRSIDSEQLVVAFLLPSLFLCAHLKYDGSNAVSLFMNTPVSSSSLSISSFRSICSPSTGLDSATVLSTGLHVQKKLGYEHVHEHVHKSMISCTVHVHEHVHESRDL